MTLSISTKSIFLTLQASVIFIDYKIAEYQDLAFNLVPETDMVIFKSNQDGISHITSVLSQNNYSKVNIFARSVLGRLYLGNTQLSLDTLNTYQEELKTWFNTISPSSKINRGNLFLYGCNVAAGDAGSEFINRLQRITKSSIFASSTKVGNSAEEGNWNLNY